LRNGNIYGQVTNHAEITPTVQDTNVLYNSGTQTLSWTKGNGEQSLVVASKKPFDFFPLDGITYSKADDNPRFQVVYRRIYLRGFSFTFARLMECKAQKSITDAEYLLSLCRHLRRRKALY